MKPNQICFPVLDFLDADGNPVNIEGFPVTVRSSDESMAVWRKFDATGHPDEAGLYGVQSLAVGSPTLEYEIENPDKTKATKTGVLVIALDDAMNGPLTFSAPIDVPA